MVAVIEMKKCTFQHLNDLNFIGQNNNDVSEDDKQDID